MTVHPPWGFLEAWAVYTELQPLCLTLVTSCCRNPGAGACSATHTGEGTRCPTSRPGMWHIPAKHSISSLALGIQRGLHCAFKLLLPGDCRHPVLSIHFWPWIYCLTQICSCAIPYCLQRLLCPHHITYGAYKGESSVSFQLCSSSLLRCLASWWSMDLRAILSSVSLIVTEPEHQVHEGITARFCLVS